MAEGRDAVGPGDSFRLYVFGPEVEFTVVEVRDAVPGIDPEGLWVVAGLAELEAGRGQPLDPTTRFVRAPDEATPAIREVAETAGGADARVRSQVELAASLRGSPAVEAVTAGIALSVVVAAIYAGLALLVAMALAGADRANEVALLRTLGLSDRQTGALAVAEQGPTVAAAFAMGALLGLGLFLILRPGLGLSVVVGSTLDVPLDLDAAAIALFIVLAAAGAVAAILLGALAGRAASPIAVARRGLDT
jgi:putative ABC transport system permease protein